MISWWRWALAGFILGCVVTFWYFGKLKAYVLRENMRLTEENERLRRRVQLIGERTHDGTLDPQGER